MDLVWLVVAVALCGSLAWFGMRIEPHWVSKDGRRFICQSQLVTPHGDALGRWRETRVEITPDDELCVIQKRLFRRQRSYWELAAESPDPPRRRAIFLLRGRDDTTSMLTLRMPAKSRALDGLRALTRR